MSRNWDDPVCLGLISAYIGLTLMVVAFSYLPPRLVRKLSASLSSIRRGGAAKASSSSSSSAAAWPPKHIIVTNDDGPDSDFFKRWLQLLKYENISHTTVVPASQFSFVGKGLSRGPIVVTRKSDQYYEVDGSPATCVNLALYQLEGLRSMPRDDILIISGPNIGHNVGLSSILSSGTVGAALEGALLGTRSVALSFPFSKGFNNWTPGEVDSACSASLKVIRELWEGTELSDTERIFNINVPIGSDINTQVKRTIIETSPSSRYSTLYAAEGPTSEKSALLPSQTAAASSPAWESAAPSLGKQEVEGPTVAGGKEVYVWKPVGVRAFDSDSLNGESDAAAVKAGFISVTPLALSGGILR